MTQQNGDQVAFPLYGDERRYDLAGEGVQIQVTYTHLAEGPTNLSLSYQGLDGGNGTFSRNEIRSLDSELGTLLTVTLPNTRETLKPVKTTVSVFLPVVHPTAPPEWSANVKTLAIVTNTTGLPTDPSLTGQTQTYQVYELEGTLTYTRLPHGVKLTVDGASFYVGDPIIVTLSNQLALAIEFPDQQTECSVIQLQRQENGNWNEVNRCIRGIPTRMITLEAGKDLTVKFVSSSESAGLYRAALNYRPAKTEGDLVGVSSQEFQVGIARPEGH